jgi:regulator of RNase E activity RraB
MKLFKKKTIVQNDEWKFWDFYDEEGFYGLNFLDATYLDTINQKGFKKEYYLKVLIPEFKQAQGKFPTPETNVELQKLEDELIALLEANKVDCKQVHRCIYFGAKRMLFEVADISDFEEYIDKWKRTLENYSLEIIEDQPWIIYNEMQPDEYAWQQMGNRQVYDSLVNHGSDPNKIHIIEHAIFGDSNELKKLEIELVKEGGKTLTFEDEMLEMGFENVLDLDQINNMTYFLMDKSKEFNCKYDGWSASIVK